MVGWLYQDYQKPLLIKQTWFFRAVSCGPSKKMAINKESLGNYLTARDHREHLQLICNTMGSIYTPISAQPLLSLYCSIRIIPNIKLIKKSIYAQASKILNSVLK